MAILNVNYMSKALMRTVDVKIILPIDCDIFPGKKPREDKPLKTLYLLHGVFGDNNDWIKGTRIALWAEENNLAVVMPSAENQFYTNQICPGFQYGDFIGRELVDITRRMFPLSQEKEDTFIGGLSMGGYGALMNGIRGCDTFGYVLALSSALTTGKAASYIYETPFMPENRYYMERCFGDLTNITNTNKHLQALVNEILAQGKALPHIFMACGTEDRLLECNDEGAAFLKEKGADITYLTGQGAHTWKFWDTYIKKGLEWLPLERAEEKIHSGNIGRK